MVEAHGLWYFILTTSENEEEGEALLVETRSKISIDPLLSNKKKRDQLLLLIKIKS